ncbi:MAG: polysaccharide deacetylase family protein [Candidatus Omnitrophica bacterium]|nr:polysaccharide deacetylase family protein [Candidatus Omnitrophota bacterium]
MMKLAWTQRFILGLAVCVAALSALYGSLRDKNVIPIMMYHHVQPLGHHEANWVNPENFEKQMAFIQREGYQVLTLSDMVARITSGKPLPRRVVVITLDDGYEDNYTNAYPVLRKYGFPAVIFVPSRFVDQPGYLTAPQLRAMTQSGLIEIGSHTLTHQFLPSISPQQQWEQISRSRQELSRLLGKDVRFFCYPIGGYSEEIVELVKKAGYAAAFTTNRGKDRFNRNIYELQRIRFNNHDSSFSMWIKLGGYYNLLRKTKNPN